MTRSVQSKLFSKQNRLKKIKQSRRKDDPQYLQIAVGMLLGYKRTTQTNGNWHGKIKGDLIGLEQKYKKFEIGQSDDHADADGLKILNLQQAQERLHEIKNAYTKKLTKPKKSITFREAADLYYEHYMERKTRPNSTHRHYLDRVVTTEIPRRLKQPNVYKNTTLGSLRLDDILLDDLESIKFNVAKTARQNDYKLVKLSEVEKARRRKSTANRLVVIIKAILNYAYLKRRDTHVKSNGEWLDFKKFPDVEQNRKDWWDADECQAWINKCNEPSFRNFFIGAISCGFRFGEQSMLTVGNLEMEADTKHVVVPAEITKTGRERKVIIPSQYVDFYRTLAGNRPKSDLLFVYRGGKRGDQKFASSKIYKAFLDIAKAAGLRRLQWHCLRHSYASELVNAGVPLKIVADQLGHTTTLYVEKWYAHLKADVIQQAVDLLPQMHNIIQDQASVVKIKGLRTNNSTPALHDDKHREAVWVKPDNAEELLAKQNSRYFQVVQRAKKRGETYRGSTWKHKKEAANEKG